MSACLDPKYCHDSGYRHGRRGLLSMSPRCEAWSDGWREGTEDRKKEDES